MNLAFVLATLVENSVAMKWFENNSVKINSGVTLLSLETHLNISNDRIWESRTVKLL